MAARASFSLVGDAEMLRTFERLEAATRGKMLETAVVAGALPIMNRAKESALRERVTSPNNTGNLARSIHIGGHQGREMPTSGSDIGGAVVREDSVTLLIGTNVEYARRVELGYSDTDSLGRTYSQAAHPYLRPAIDEKKDEAMREIGIVLQQQLRRAAS